MKNKQKRAIRLLIVAMIPFLTSNCVNSIEEETAILTPGNITIKISSNILCAQSRGNSSQFENDDAIGLYVLAESQNLTESRYVDNMRFTCTSEGLIPDKEVFYPAGDNKCDFISYYPHQEKAIAANESNIKVVTKMNQNTPSAYEESDFMVAKTTGISPSNETVKLDFKHKLSQLNIILQLTGKDNIEDTQKNTTVFINACTKATYDFNADSFSELSTKQNITPNGEWTINKEKKRLTGKKLLLIPQQTAQCKISLRINGQTFSTSLPNELLLESNTSSEVVLYFDSGTGISRLEPSISDWEEGNSKDAILEKEENVLHIAKLNFDQTGVHQIMTESNTVIAEVCKEYLLGDNIDDQAIVLYPTATKNQGIILQLLNSSEDVHGGSITWDVNDNSFTYTPGSSAPITALYINAEGNIVCNEPIDAQIITAIGHELIDKRGSEIITYPITKIGTQYWMAKNLNATKYNDGSDIEQITKLSKTTAGYFLENGNRFYNEAAVTKGKLAPKEWKIPNNAEWEKLKKYVNYTSAVLKAGTQWKSLSDISKPNNKTGFNGEPTGFYGKTKDGDSSVYGFSNERTAYWNMESSQTTLSELCVSLIHNNNAIRGAKHTEYSGYSVRCIKE